MSKYQEGFVYGIFLGVLIGGILCVFVGQVWDLAIDIERDNIRLEYQIKYEKEEG